MVDDIPDVLLDAFTAKGSVHASSILKEEGRDIVASWIRRNLVSPDEFELVHDHSVPPAHTNEFKDYIASFEDRGFLLWNVKNDAEMTLQSEVRPTQRQVQSVRPEWPPRLPHHAQQE